MKERAATFVLIIPVLIWAFSFVVVRLVMTRDAFSDWPFFFLALRFTTATICFAPVLLNSFKNQGDRARFSFRAGLILGLIMLIGYFCQTLALGRATAGRVAFLTALSVLAIPIWDRIWERKRLPNRKWLAVIIAVAGLAFLCRRDVGLSPSLGELLAFAAMLAFSADYKFVERQVKSIGPGALTAHSICWLAIGSWILSLTFEAPRWSAMDSQGILAVLYVGIFATAVAFYLQNWCQQQVSARSAALVFALESPLAAVMGALFLGEAYGMSELIGCGLVFAAIIIAEWQQAPSVGAPMA
jgi:drug/metabolite transporter (DMT)-like permease